MEIYLQVGGQQYGPYTIEQLDAMWKARQIPADSLYWYQGMQEWGKVTEFKPPSTGGTPNPAAQATSIERPEGFWLGDDYFASLYWSPNGRYVVGVYDGEINDRYDGLRKKGACLLAEVGNDRVCFVTRIRRPHNPHVNDNGCVVVEDWKDYGKSRSSAVIAFDRTGNRLWTKHFKAHIHDSTMWSDGSRITVEVLPMTKYVLEMETGKVFSKD